MNTVCIPKQGGPASCVDGNDARGVPHLNTRGSHAAAASNGVLVGEPECRSELPCADQTRAQHHMELSLLARPHLAVLLSPLPIAFARHSISIHRP
jgi:hypothetical protein